MYLKRAAIVIMVVLLVCGFAGCSAQVTGGNMSAADSKEWYDGVYDRAPGATAAPESESSSGTPAVQQQKLIRTMALDVETNDLDTLLRNLDTKINSQGGYVENRVVRNGNGNSSRYASLKIRVPVEKLNEFVEHISGASNVVHSQESAQDVTLRYVATKSRITALETEQTRLLELLAKAETMDDLLLIESRLTDVRTELEEVTSQLRLYDNLVDYATIDLSVTEVKEFTVVEEETLWQRIGSGFLESIKDIGTALTELFVFLIVGSPYFVILTAVVLVIALLVKHSRGRRMTANKNGDDKNS